MNVLRIIVILCQIILFVNSFSKFSDFQQWCYVGSNWLPYNPSTSTCFTCQGNFFLRDNSKENEKLVCCDTGAENITTTRKECQYWPRGKIGRACANENYYLEIEECDGYNHCGDGSDEKLCVECPDDFRCANKVQCFGTEKVCDGHKNCADASDELNCLTHIGRCEGFRCTTFMECIEKERVCDGKKDCLDGGDEIGCVVQNPDLFFCDNNSTIAKTGICDGKRDCFNGVDETHCFSWSPWALWSTCRCSENPSTQYRNRTCIGARFITSPGNCGLANTNESQICSCPSEPPTSTTSDSPEVLETQWIIIIALASAIFFLSAIGIIYGAWYSKQAKIAIEKQAEVVANIYNQSTMSLSPMPATATSSGGFPFPKVTASGSIPNSNTEHNPDLSRMRTLRGNLPLPVTPLEAMTNHAYQSIEDLRLEISIDPYAQSNVNDSSLERIEEANFSERDDVSNVTVVETYSTSVISSNEPEQYLKTPPPAPSEERTFDKDGYLVPTSYSKKYGTNKRGSGADGKGGTTYAVTTKRPDKPKRSLHRSPILGSTPEVSSETELNEQYATMRSCSADGIFNTRPKTTIFRDKIGQSSMSPAHLNSITTSQSRRRAKSLENLTDQVSFKKLSATETKEEQDMYSSMSTPSLETYPSTTIERVMSQDQLDSNIGSQRDPTEIIQKEDPLDVEDVQENERAHKNDISG
ncbi:uncharacterized protein LOC120348048 [Styela clava]